MNLNSVVIHPQPKSRSSAMTSTSSSTHKAASSGTHSSSGVKKDVSVECRPSFKFLEAMKNPNWRERRTDGASSSSNSTDPLTSLEIPGPGGSLVMNCGLTTSPLEDSGKSVPKNSTHRAQEPLPGDRSKSKRTNLSVHRQGEASRSDDVERSQGVASKSLCRVVKRSTLSPASSEARGLYLFEVLTCALGSLEVVTHEPLDAGLNRSLATIEPFRRIQRRDQLQISDCTDGSSVVPAVHLEEQMDGANSSGPERPLETSRVQFSNHKPHSNVAQLRLAEENERRPSSQQQDGPQSLCDDGRSKAVSFAEDCYYLDSADEAKANMAKSRDAAFLKMLEKLNKPPGSKPLAREVRDSGYRTGSGSDEVSANSTDAARGQTARQRCETGVNTVRRENTASDFVVNYRAPEPGSHEAEGSRSSGTADGEKPNSNCLNPKAREFLSFLFEDPILETRAARRGFSVTRATSGSCESQESGRDITSERVVTSAPYLTAGVPCFDPAPVVCSSMSPRENTASRPEVRPMSSLPYGLGSGYNNSLGLTFGSNARPVSDGLWGREFPLPEGWFRGAIIHGSGKASSTGPQLAESTFCTLPSRSQAKMPFPLPILPGSMAQAQPFGRPAPVPKPKEPDAWGQQAYEAYIEQRKAMEPGYALECKMRQQRRAQRGLTTNKTSLDSRRKVDDRARR